MKIGISNPLQLATVKPVSNSRVSSLAHTHGWVSCLAYLLILAGMAGDALAGYVQYTVRNSTSEDRSFTAQYYINGSWQDGGTHEVEHGHDFPWDTHLAEGELLRFAWDGCYAMKTTSGATVYTVTSSSIQNAGVFEMVEVTISSGSTVSEGNTANCTVSRGSASTSYALAVTVYPGGGSPMASYSSTGDTTKDFSAQESGEYNYISGTITILSGNASRTVTVYAWSDGFIESAENARLSIFGTSSYKVKSSASIADFTIPAN